MNILDFYIDPTKICIFSKSSCVYCKKAIILLNTYNVNIQLIELDKLTKGITLSNQLTKLTNHTTVPNIFIFGKHVGGFSELNKLSNSGTLTNMIYTQSLIYQCDFCGKKTTDKNIECSCFPIRFYDREVPL